MLSTDFRKLIAPQARILNFIWMAFTASTLIYVGVVFLAVGMGSAESPDTQLNRNLGPLSYNQVGIGVMVISGWLGFFYRKKALNNEVLKKKVPAEQVWPPAGEQATLHSKLEDQELFQRLSDSEKNLAGLWLYYQTTMIVVAAFFESIAVLGVILAILGGNFLIAVPASAASLILLIINRPRPGEFFENVRI